MAPRLELFAFRYRDPRTGKWIRARYRAERHEIAARYAEWEITGQAEIRDVDANARPFTPHKSALDAELRRYSERPPELRPAINAVETFLLAVFLRRYVTYCARRGRFAAMNGAARLFRDSDSEFGDTGIVLRLHPGNGTEDKKSGHAKKQYAQQADKNQRSHG